jgi:hypothetical protein
MTATKDEQNKAAKAEIKEQRAREGAKAMQEYQKERLAVLARTEKLRAARLAREAAEPVQEKNQPKGTR